jgi:hypothetical protein
MVGLNILQLCWHDFDTASIRFVLKRFAPDIETNVNFWGKCIFTFYFEEELRNHKGNLGSLGLFWSYKVLKLTFLHLNYF